ncbi:MAG: nitronate monooxygenase [Pseudomonadota bacterium]|nr:nitronate monooxygenase [Pseudomonadota bacterium]
MKKLFERGSNFLGTTYPILGGAMTWVSENNLVSAISNAGGLGVLACGSMNADQLKKEILFTKKKTKKPFGVNLILLHPEINQLINCCINNKVEIVVFAGGFPKKSQIEILKAKKIKTICFATTLAIAKKMIQNGIDALILEGNEAGGHIGPVSINVLVQEILPYVKQVPIFVAGGIGRGEIILKFLELGASGCQIGTRFVCANESIAHEKFKQIFIKSEARNAQVSIKIDERLPIIPVRAIENEATENFIKEQRKLLSLVENKKLSLKDAQLSIEHFWAGSLKRAVINGDIENGSLMAGQSVSLVKEIQSVKEIFNELVLQMENQINCEQKDLKDG